jgi:hypothetical protein
MTWHIWLLAVFLLALAALAVRLMRHRAHRRNHLTGLAKRRPELIRDTVIRIAAEHPEGAAQEFASDRLARVENFVTGDCLLVLRQEAESHIADMTRTFIPTHKKGATLSYEKIHTLAPHALAFYHSAAVQEWIAAITGVTVVPTPNQDQSSLSVLCYHEPGDHINWHYDHNFYRGRHFTVLLSLVNEGPSGLSQGTLQRQCAEGGEQNCDTAPNVLVVFEGAKVRHRATPIGENERRVILSMTY